MIKASSVRSKHVHHARFGKIKDALKTLQLEVSAQ
jgi:hypothetical protein